MSRRPVDGIYTCPQCGSMYSRYGEWIFRHIKEASICGECHAELKESEDPFSDILKNPHRPDALEGLTYCLEKIGKFRLAKGVNWHTRISNNLTLFEIINILVEAKEEIESIQQ